MIIKGSPTKRHVSRTHRVALDWLFDRINLDPKDPNQICWPPKANSRTRWPKVVLHVMNEIISSVCWISWISSMFSRSDFLFKQKAECHVQESSGKCVKKFRRWRNRDQWIWCQGTSWVQRKLLPKIRVFRTAQGIKSWIRVVFHPAPGNWGEISWGGVVNLQAQLHETGARWGRPNRKVKDGIPQHADLRPSMPWESLQEPAEKVGSCRREAPVIDWYRNFEDQRIDLGIIYVDNDESRCSSWNKLHWNFGSIQEHTLRRTQEFVRYHCEIDIGTWSRNSEIGQHPYGRDLRFTHD